MKNACSSETPPQAPSPRRPARRAVAIILWAVFILVVVAAVCIALTDVGRDSWYTFWRGEAEREAVAKLRLQADKVLLITEPPSQRATSIDFSAAANVDDETLQHVGCLYRLGTLNLANCNIADRQLQFVTDLPNLTTLVLTGTPITDNGLVHLRAIPVEALYLNATRISDAGLDHLAGLHSVKILDLSNTSLTNAGVAKLRPLIGVTWLLLSGTAITDAAIEDFAAMPNLTRLTISHTAVTPAAVNKLKNLLPRLSVDR